MKLVGNLLDVLESCEKVIANHPQLDELKKELAHMRQRSTAPMRVAIVGFIKAGKSTLMNALLKEKVVAVGSTETTFNVNWFKYGKDSQLIVHFKDSQKKPQIKRLSELEALTCRNDEHREFLTSIRHIEVYYPSAMLQHVEIIDTPGLGSIYKDDAQNTLDFLGMKISDVARQTQMEAASADAILYLFSKSVSTTEASIIEEFIGPSLSRANPINAIGVLTKTDMYWPQTENPLVQGQEIAARLMKEARVKSMFYNIYPVCGHLGWGSHTMTDHEWNVLEKLAVMSENSFASLSANVQRFVREREGVVGAADRRKLLERLGLYGVVLARKLYLEGFRTKAALIGEMLEYSGMNTLYHILETHFGNRSILIKLSMGLQRIKHCCFMLQQERLTPDVLAAVEKVGGLISSFADQEHALRELELLKLYYDEKIVFDQEECRMLLEVTGEFGMAVLTRLGAEETMSVIELQNIARQRILYWRAKVNDPLGRNPASREGARIMLNAYQNIMAELKGV